MEAIFVANAEQERIARERVGDRAPIISGARFYLAEDYHQKYYLRHDALLMRELADYAPKDFIESSLAARLNGYVARKGSPDQLRAELPRFGLSPDAQQHLERVVARR